MTVSLTDSSMVHSYRVVALTEFPVVSLSLLEALISWIVTGYLDEMSPDYNIPSSTNLTLYFFNDTERRIDPPIYQADVVFQFVVASAIRSTPASVWYHYQFFLDCFYGNANPGLSGQPLNDTTAVRRIEQQLQQYLHQGVALVHDAWDFRAQSCGLLGLATQDPRATDIPFVDEPWMSGAPMTTTTHEAPPALDSTVFVTYALPMNVQYWVGATVFWKGWNLCFTIILLLDELFVLTVNSIVAIIIIIGLAALFRFVSLCQHHSRDAVVDAMGGAPPPPHYHAPRVGQSGHRTRRGCLAEYGMEIAGQ